MAGVCPVRTVKTVRGGGNDVGRMTGDWSHTERKRAAASASEGNMDSVVARNLSGAIMV